MTNSEREPCETGAPTADDATLRLLASNARRVALRELQETKIRSLADLGAAVVQNDATDFQRQERARRLLHHCHLPALDAAGILDYDSDDRSIRYRGDETVTELLAVLND